MANLRKISSITSKLSSQSLNMLKKYTTSARESRHRTHQYSTASNQNITDQVSTRADLFVDVKLLNRY